MRNYMLTEVELSHSTIPFRKGEDGTLYPAFEAILEKGTRVFIDAPQVYRHPHSDRVVRLLRYTTKEDGIAELRSGNYLMEHFSSFITV